jgi:TrmH family RNA methyltransferase
VLRAAQGAHFALAIREVADLTVIVGEFAGLSVATLVQGGTPLYQLDLAGPVAWIFGNEGAGVSPTLAAAAKARATIPMHAATESLNVAAAAAICLFEAVRQRKIA